MRPMALRLLTIQKLQARKTPSPGKTVVHLGSVVALDQAVRHQFALDRFDGTPDAGISSGEEANQGHEEHAGVELVRAVCLHEGVLLRVEGPFADLVVDLLAD